MEVDEEEFEKMMEDELDLVRDLEAEKFKKALFTDSSLKRKDSSFTSIPDGEEADIQIHRPLKRTKISSETEKLENLRYLNVSVNPEGRNRQYYCVRLRDEETNPQNPPQMFLQNTYLNDKPFFELMTEASKIRSLAESTPKPQRNPSNTSQSLWVETYKPSNFMHLLSDDAINRSLLQWMKLWDRIVFNKHVKSELIDDTHRPTPRIVLLHGPPGLGKTTLAFILSRHAGYNPIEINSSDDRSIAAFKAKVEPAIQMQSVLSEDSKPNCIIIDEIDGVPAATIKYLVDLSTDKNKSVGLLRRPIICICNDLYTPSLRLLRQNSKVIMFPPTSSYRLVERLKFISTKEKFSADPSALTILCEKTNNDIRACLSTLQFFKARGIQKLHVRDVQNASIGLKDMNKSNFYIWEKIFQLSRGGSKNSQGGGSDNSLKSRYNSIYEIVNGYGDYDRLMNGVFENYLDMKFKDTRFENVSMANEWMIFFDMCQKQIHQTQIYTLLSYSAFPFIAAHFALASHARTKINFPTSYKEFTAKLNKSINLTTICMSEMKPICRSFVSHDSLIRDVLPNLFEILNPDLRSVNSQLYSPREKKVFEDLISIMISYNITYAQEKSPMGQFVYRYDPSLDEVAHFPGIKHSTLSYSVQQVVAHEIAIEKMRRSDKRESTVKGNVQVEKEPKKEVDKKKKKEEECSPDPVDFFNRKIPKEVLEAREKDKKKNALISGVIFVFKEGYNNAVRRTVRVSDFL